jgi:hypothetical protein
MTEKAPDQTAAPRMKDRAVIGEVVLCRRLAAVWDNVASDILVLPTAEESLECSNSSLK